MRSTSTIVALAAAVAVAFAALAGAADAAKPNPIVGSWKLNVQLSRGPDGNPPDMQRLEARRRERSGWDQQRPGGAAALGGPFAEGAPQGQGDAVGQPPARGMQGGPAGAFRGGRGERSGFGPVPVLTVAIDAKEVVFSSAEGVLKTLPVDGTPVVRSGRRYHGETRAKLADAGVTLTTTSQDGRVITEVYALADDGSGRLVHTVDAKGGMNPPMSARWVYDRVPAEGVTSQQSAPPATGAPAPASGDGAGPAPAVAPTPATRHQGR